jgi:DUF4097 and DUF4098 domain-containing protein YvlB
VGAIPFAGTSVCHSRTIGLATTVHAAAAVQDDDYDSEDAGGFTERDELNKTVDLAPGSQVEVAGINGTVTIGTSNGTTAEIHVVRTARRREDLQYRRVLVEQVGGKLTIRGEDNKGRKTPEVRQVVELKLPRNIDLGVHGVNGRVNVGEIDGQIRVSGINGSVDVAHARTIQDLSGVNGRVTIGVTRLDESGLRVSGINGKVILKFAEQVNADISVTGINGNVFTESGGITVIGKMNPSSFRGRIGSGGPQINVSGVNGNVELLGDGSPER